MAPVFPQVLVMLFKISERVAIHCALVPISLDEDKIIMLFLCHWLLFWIPLGPRPTAWPSAALIAYSPATIVIYRLSSRPAELSARPPRTTHVL